MKPLEVSLNILKEEFTGVWTLLNDTSRYLKRAGLFDEYEPMFRSWRSDLQKRYTNTDVYKDIKRQVINMRKELRHEGHDLRMGNYDVVAVGFKSDDAPKYGFKRAVMYVSAKDIFYQTGDENHNELALRLTYSYGSGRIKSPKELHNVWYRWNHHVLEVAGADSETKENYALLSEFIEQNKMLFLKHVKGM